MLMCQGGCGWIYDEYFYVEYEYVQYIICRSCRDRIIRECENYLRQKKDIQMSNRTDNEKFELIRRLRNPNPLPIPVSLLSDTTPRGVVKPILKSKSSYFETVTYPERRIALKVKKIEAEKRRAEEAEKEAAVRRLEEAKRQVVAKRRAEAEKRRAEEAAKRRAEEAEITRLENLLLSKISLSALSLDQRKKLAKSSKRKDVLFWLALDNKEVVNLLKTNPYITEEDIVREKQKPIIGYVLLILIFVFILFLIFGGS